jgi:hypothetical protein
MSNINAIELALNDIRAIVNSEREHSASVLQNTAAQIDALIENHKVSIKMLEQLKERLHEDHAIHDNVLHNVTGDGNRG